MKQILPILLLSYCVAFANTIIAQQNKKPATKVTLPAIAAIRPSELEADLYDLAGDHFKGREAGTLNELKASAWLAEKARMAGLTPAGDDGTFFQFFPMQRSRIGPSSTVQINDSSMKIWEDVML